MPDSNLKPGFADIDAAQLEQMLEIELMQKRATWQQAKARRGILRGLSFGFLFIIIVGALAAFFFFFSSGRGGELQPAAQSESTANPTASP